MRLHRLISILLTIENSEKITARELAGQFEISVRSIYRDIDTLCEAGIPVITESGPHGGISLSKGYKTGLKQLNKDEITSLFLNGMGVMADRGSAISIGVNTSLLKLQKLLPHDEFAEIRTRINRFYVDNTPWWGERDPLEHLDSLMEGIWNCHKLNIHYQKKNQTIADRIVQPYGIVVKDFIWYLVACSEDNHTIRTYRCERIVKCILLPDTFILPDDFSIKKYFRSSLKKFKEERRESEQFPVTILINKQDLPLIRNCEVYSSRLIGDDMQVVMNMYSQENALNNFWNVLIKAEVINPREFEQAVMERLRSKLQRRKLPVEN